jgi:DNA mismatch endonuclease (patch repair protein)
MGYRFRLFGKILPGKPDIVLNKYKIIIFVHGCFWHRHKGCEKTRTPKSNKLFWRNKFKNNVLRDVKNIQKLKELGWNVLIIWECETQDRSILIDKIKSISPVRYNLPSDRIHELKAAEQKGNYDVKY